MGTRMLCTDCFETARPATLLPGSDRLELLGWLCGALPGWLYCCWRHALRIKVCAFCGGGALVREARASAARHAPEAAGAARVRSLRGAAPWPVMLATPRARLRAGGPGALLFGALFATGLASLHAPASPLLPAFVLGCAAWLSFEAGRVGHGWLRAPVCRAWDAHGRPLPIELL